MFGGEPFPEERIIDWNFVATSKSLIDEAKQKWKAQTFPKIKGDENEFISYPSHTKE
ncbi:MAG: pirin-like C-terminal cupin domain-containing protein [Vicingaceae bacterium]|nr:pirin-like C-terminal cupin domain-containing protein [Vicingaceae bacterium]